MTAPDKAEASGTVGTSAEASSSATHRKGDDRRRPKTSTTPPPLPTFLRLALRSYRADLNRYVEATGDPMASVRVAACSRLLGEGGQP